MNPQNGLIMMKTIITRANTDRVIAVAMHIVLSAFCLLSYLTLTILSMRKVLLLSLLTENEILCRV